MKSYKVAMGLFGACRKRRTVSSRSTSQAKPRTRMSLRPTTSGFPQESKTGRIVERLFETKMSIGKLIAHDYCT